MDRVDPQPHGLQRIHLSPMRLNHHGPRLFCASHGWVSAKATALRTHTHSGEPEARHHPTCAHSGLLDIQRTAPPPVATTSPEHHLRLLCPPRELAMAQAIPVPPYAHSGEPEARERLAGGGASSCERNHRSPYTHAMRSGGCARTACKRTARHHKYRSSYSTSPCCNIATYSS